MEKPKSKRMSPEARREQILDSAVELIVNSGHSSCSLEQVASAASISKALIYKYFANREELVAGILEREFTELNGRGLGEIPNEVPIEQIVRNTIGRSLKYFAERGPIIRLLSSDPAVAHLARTGNSNSKADTSAYFIQRSMDAYGVPEDVATIAVTMVINAPIQTMRYLGNKEVDLDQTIDVWTEFVIAGWRGLEKRFGKTLD